MLTKHINILWLTISQRNPLGKHRIQCRSAAITLMNSHNKQTKEIQSSLELEPFEREKQKKRKRKRMILLLKLVSR